METMEKEISPETQSTYICRIDVWFSGFEYLEKWRSENQCEMHDLSKLKLFLENYIEEDSLDIDEISSKRLRESVITSNQCEYDIYYISIEQE